MPDPVLERSSQAHLSEPQCAPARVYQLRPWVDPEAAAPRPVLSRLENRTQLGNPLPAPVSTGVGVNLYPTATEAVVFRRPRAKPHVEMGPDVKRKEDMRPEREPTLPELEAERQANLLRAARRAKSRFRRYAVANDCSRLLTLTFAKAEHERKGTVLALQRMTRALREKVGRFPYAWCIETHGGGHGKHVHLAVGRYVPKELIRKCWALGHVKINRFVKLGKGATKSVACYVAKYVSKEIETGDGRHSYDVAQGFQPECVRELFETWGEARAFCKLIMGEHQWCWDSRDFPDWEGPPVLVFTWADAPKPAKSHEEATA